MKKYRSCTILLYICIVPLSDYKVLKPLRLLSKYLPTFNNALCPLTEPKRRWCILGELPANSRYDMPLLLSNISHAIIYYNSHWVRQISVLSFLSVAIFFEHRSSLAWTAFDGLWTAEGLPSIHLYLVLFLSFFSRRCFPGPPHVIHVSQFRSSPTSLSS